MESRNTAAGLALVAMGAFIAIILPYYIMGMGLEEFVRFLKNLTIVLLLLAGSLIGATGIVLLRGFRENEE